MGKLIDAKVAFESWINLAGASPECYEHACDLELGFKAGWEACHESVRQSLPTVGGGEGEKAALVQRMAIAFHESQFNQGNYGMPWDKVSKESKKRYMEGMLAAITAMREGRGDE